MASEPARNYKAASFVPSNLDTVRGIACLLVVALHVIGDTATNGLHIPLTSGWHYAMASIEFLRMPLFTALSGYLYASNRVTKQAFGTFWWKKLRRLGCPLVFATLVIWFLRSRAYGDQTALSTALLFGFGHLWYIQALVLLFAAISIADITFRPGFTTLVLAGLVAIMTAQANIELPTHFSFNGAVYLAPYFLFGILLREQPDWLQDRRLGRLALGIVLIVLTAQQLGLVGLTIGVTLLQLPAALAGMAGVVFLLQFMPRQTWLATIGGYSYTIYLWHVVVNAAARSALLKVGITAPPVLFGLCLIVAVAVPIVLYHIARRVPLLSVVVTGEHSITPAVSLGAEAGRPLVAAASGGLMPCRASIAGSGLNGNSGATCRRLKRGGSGGVVFPIVEWRHVILGLARLIKAPNRVPRFHDRAIGPCSVTGGAADT